MDTSLQSQGVCIQLLNNFCFSPMRLHVVAFNIPWPANYGGVIDVYYKLEALHLLGASIVLHCYEYEHQEYPTEQLLNVCREVHYYPRDRGLRANLSLLPYNVYGRRGEVLLERLLLDEAPILFEGLQSCFFLTHPALRHRCKVVRPANVEHHYYRALAVAEHTFVSKAFHYIEAVKFALFERKLKYADAIVPVSESDTEHYQSVFPTHRVQCVPCFHSHREINSRLGSGKYILYHAKLSVAENEVAALWLIDHVLSRLNEPAIIAGMNPSKRLIDAIHKYPHISLIANPSDEQMKELILQAHIHLLWTAQPTGLKLKLLNSLFLGRHIVANSLMLTGTRLDDLCHIPSSANEAISMCQHLMHKPFTSDDVARRMAGLFPAYDTLSQARGLLELIFSSKKRNG